MTADQQIDLSEKISAAVTAYVDALNSGTAEEIADLYADGATVEDPIGAPLRTTRDELVEFYGIITGMPHREATVAWTKIAGDTAVFEFTLVTGTDDAKFKITPVDIMVFDENGKVSSMRAVWSPSDLEQI
ncbi:nuclear transport factor 2 family protein [Gordonia sp. HY442]|uniref:nuclear transport factor 2 family protein n=1 Tax=Gordonia zhenghanii TaxID=2911516 RepID=UPI001F424DBE|nr:nuclear transport factor 2 family protein [Gordonia zhenghanii]MCF8603705.1 nuclear transport factor 2 family protein [Gordonia zhenghanii]